MVPSLGTLSASVLDSTVMSAEGGYSLASPLVYWYGHTSVNENQDLFKHLTTKLVGVTAFSFYTPSYLLAPAALCGRIKTQVWCHFISNVSKVNAPPSIIPHFVQSLHFVSHPDPSPLLLRRQKAWKKGWRMLNRIHTLV